MRPGTKPTPTRLRALRGNPGGRPMPRAEPQHDPLELEAHPSELATGRPAADVAACAEWDRLAPALIARGQVTKVDRGVLVAYCVKWGQWVALEATAAQQPFTTLTATGYPVPNPTHGMANKALSLVLKAAAELGITPSSRSRVSGTDPTDRTPTNPLTRFLKPVS